MHIHTNIIQYRQIHTYRYNLFSDKGMIHTDTVQIKQKQTFENGSLEVYLSACICMYLSVSPVCILSLYLCIFCFICMYLSLPIRLTNFAAQIQTWYIHDTVETRQIHTRYWLYVPCTYLSVSEQVVFVFISMYRVCFCLYLVLSACIWSVFQYHVCICMCVLFLYVSVFMSKYLYVSGCIMHVSACIA